MQINFCSLANLVDMPQINVIIETKLDKKLTELDPNTVKKSRTLQNAFANKLAAGHDFVKPLKIPVGTQEALVMVKYFRKEENKLFFQINDWFASQLEANWDLQKPSKDGIYIYFMSKGIVTYVRAFVVSICAF